MLNREELHEKADAMRAILTPSEERAKDSLVGTFAFEMQVVFGFYILDFIIPSKLLIVEIDGESHLGQKEYDKRRDAFCEQFGLSVLRIPNNLANTAGLRAAKYPDVEGYEKAWPLALRRAAHKQGRAEEKSGVAPAERKAVVTANQSKRDLRRAEMIKAVQALPLGASYKQVRAATAGVAPKNQHKKKKRRPQIDMSIEAKIAANRRQSQYARPTPSHAVQTPQTPREKRDAHQAMIRASRLVPRA